MASPVLDQGQVVGVFLTPADCQALAAAGPAAREPLAVIRQAARASARSDTTTFSLVRGLLSVEEVAELEDRAPSTIRRWCAPGGRLADHAHRVGRSWGIDHERYRRACAPIPAVRL